MVSDRLEEYFKRIIINTENNMIKWRPFREIFDANVKNEIYADITILNANEFSKIIFEDSFYARKDGETLFFISSEWESGLDGSISLHRELKCLCNDFNRILNVPEYDVIPVNKLLSAIKTYWEHKCMDYNQEISDIFGVLNSFAEGTDRLDGD